MIVGFVEEFGVVVGCDDEWIVGLGECVDLDVVVYFKFCGCC